MTTPILNDYLNTRDGFKLSYAYFPKENAKAIVQLIPGAMEYKERYFELIDVLNENGYTCIISDTRGHGHSVSEKYPFGHVDNAGEILQDLSLVTDYAKNLQPNLPVALLGHSLGSLLARNYLMQNDDKIDLLILLGTVAPVSIINIGIIISKLAMLFTGGNYGHSRIISRFSPMNKPPEKWIAYNKQYLLDRNSEYLMKFNFDNGAYYSTLELVRNLAQPKRYQVKNPSLPIYSFSGKDDPITGGEKGLENTKNALSKIGYKNFYKKVYPNMMHEIIKEENKAVVFQDIVKVLDEHFV